MICAMIRQHSGKLLPLHASCVGIVLGEIAEHRKGHICVSTTDEDRDSKFCVALHVSQDKK